MMNHTSENKKKGILFSRFFWGSVFVILAILFARHPIEAVDTDLWFHLSEGKYFFDNSEIAHNSFFSFLPERAKITYSWLFQALIYKIYSFSGYQGLVILRAVLFLLIIAVLFGFFHKTQRARWFPFVFVLFMALLLMRCLILRPHVFSFLFLILFISILEIKPDKIKYLPVVGISWVNMHGIAYPVMILITVSYAAGFFYERIRNNAPLTKDQTVQLLFLVLTMATIFLSPHGTKLLTVPFISTKYASQYIQELGGDGIRILDFLTFHAEHLSPSPRTIFNVIFWGVVVSVISKALRRQLKTSHALLFAGAGFLLFKSNNRFMYEFALLSLPVLATKNLSVPEDNKIADTHKPIFYYPAVILLFISAVFYFLKYFSNPPRFPLSQDRLPSGVTAFLKKMHMQGTVLNFPNSGGYLQWMLYPEYKIAINMEAPIPFTDEDFFYVINAFFDDTGFQNFKSQYDPSFISVPLYIYLNYDIRRRFGPEFVCIFFDDAEVLFANKSKLPQIADEFALGLDPLCLANFDESVLHQCIQGNAAVIDDLYKIDGIYPDCKMVNWAIANILIAKNDCVSARKHASRIIENFPDAHLGYELLADIDASEEMYDAAITSYVNALKKFADSEIYKKLSVCYVKTGKYQKAYAALKKGTDIYSTDIGYGDLFQLGLLALQVNEKDEARILLEFANYKTPKSDPVLKNRIQAILADPDFKR